MKINGVALATTATGILFAWSGIKGWSVLGTLQDVISGKQPAGTTGTSHPITQSGTPAVSSSGTPGSASGSAISSDASQYVGHKYVYGGAPGAAGTGGWDCSSFVNWVVSHDLGLPWPGAGRYTGTTHGPPTGQWAAWFLAKGGGSTTVKAADVQAGDIIVWATHMGIAVSNTQMISAQNPSIGTQVSAIAGDAPGPILVYGRLPTGG